MLALLVARIVLVLIVLFIIYKIGFFRFLPKLINEVKAFRAKSKTYKKDLKK